MSSYLDDDDDGATAWLDPRPEVHVEPAQADDDEPPPPDYHAFMANQSRPGHLAATMPGFLNVAFPNNSPPARAPPAPPAAPAALPPVELGAAKPVPGIPTAPRTVRVGTDLVPQFLDLARANSQRDLETCGILAGTLVWFM